MTIDVGDYGVCPENNYPDATGCTLGGTPFAIPAGVEDVDTFLLTLEDIFTITTTTNTDLLTQDYNLVGVPAVAPAPEPSSWALLGGSLLAMLWRRRKPIFRKLHTTRGSVAG
jgi:PEP-CTERM motif